MSPGCFAGDCFNWGAHKAIDTREKSLNGLAHTSWADFPYIQVDLGYVRNDIMAVRLVSRADGWLIESQHVNVYLSNTTSWTSTGSLCQSNVTFTNLGESVIVLCPVNSTGRYVTVWLNTTEAAHVGVNKYLSLQEIVPLRNGEHGLCQE